MTQLDLFDWQPPRKVLPFPYHRQPGVLADIADTFVREGYDAGNARMRQHGWEVWIASLIRIGMEKDDIGREVDKFTAAARAHATKRLLQTQRVV